MDCIQITFEIIKTTCLVITLIIAIFGLQAWRRQLKGTSEFEIAKDILENVYRVKNAFLYVRNPAIFSGEYPPELQNKNMLTHEENIIALEHAYNERLKHFNTEFNKLEESFIKGLVLFEKSDNIIIPIRKCRAELIVALQDLLNSKKYPNHVDRNRLKEIDCIIYYLGKDSKYNQFTIFIDDAIKIMVNWLKPMLSNRNLRKSKLEKLSKKADDFNIIIRNDA